MYVLPMKWITTCQNYKDNLLSSYFIFGKNAAAAAADDDDDIVLISVLHLIAFFLKYLNF
jgi:hypothetical protein